MEDFETKLNENENITDECAPEENTPCEPVDEALEKVGFIVTPALINEHYRILGRVSWIFSVAIGILLFATFSFENLTHGIAVGIVGMVIMKLAMRFIYSRNAKQAAKKLEDSTSIYELRDGCIDYSGFEHGDLVHFRRIKLDNIVSVTKTAKALSFVSDGISYIIDNEALPSDSKIEAVLAQSKPIKYALGAKRSKERNKSKKPGGKAMNIAMLALALASVVASILIFVIDFNPQTAWLPLLFLALPVAYFVVFAIAEFQNRKTSVALTVIAAICAGIIWLFGVMFTSFNMYGFIEEDAIEIKEEACEILDIKMTPTEAYYFETTVFANGAFTEVENADIYMDETDTEGAKAFRKQITENGNWMSADSSLYMDFYSSYTQSAWCDTVLIYNATTGKYNTPPIDSGTYYVLLYSASNHFVSIYKFDIE